MRRNRLTFDFGLDQMLVGGVLAAPVVVADSGEAGSSGRAVSAFPCFAASGGKAAEFAGFRRELFFVGWVAWHGSLEGWRI